MKETMTVAILSMGYPHWLIIVGALLLMLGLVGLALRQRRVKADADAAASRRELFKPPADLSREDFNNLVAK